MEFKLIQGKFPAKDAFEVLTQLISSKIQFHQLRNFSVHERTGKDDENAVLRIETLEEVRHQLLLQFPEWLETGKLIEIEAEVKIRLVE